ncbi:MAG TPA: peroxide stress protein YaaA [Saprospiraceae bacterium]|nr:peroxide stress protein YaaA [Saprospiraceae bacterium]
MLILTSPSKTLKTDIKTNISEFHIPHFKKEALEWAGILRKMDPPTLMKLMNISDKLAKENFDRYQNFSSDFTLENSFPALLAFQGDVYQGLQADKLNDEDLRYADHHIRILSGLYGVLRPLDIMQPYRLEIGLGLKNKKGVDLYTYWRKKITGRLNEELKNYGYHQIINLASNEYFKAVSASSIKADIFQVQFKEFKNGKLQFFSFHAKKARGSLMRHIIVNRLSEAEQIKSFNMEGYEYSDEYSSDRNYLFIR